jgi:hypothetical protein
MYFNVFGEKVSRARYREMLNAAKNRRELIGAQNLLHHECHQSLARRRKARPSGGY